MRVADLEFVHRIMLRGSPGHLWQVTVGATEPLTREGVSAFIRYEDQVATRFGYVVSRWVTEDADGPYAGCLVYAVGDSAPGTAPREHPSNDGRFREMAEVGAAPDGARRPQPPEPPVPLLWARGEVAEPLVPVSVHAGPAAVSVTVMGAGLVPQRTDLLLAGSDLPDRLATSPTAVVADVYAYTHPTRTRVLARIARGRARPAATLSIGTLEQFGALDG